MPTFVLQSFGCKCGEFRQMVEKHLRLLPIKCKKCKGLAQSLYQGWEDSPNCIGMEKATDHERESAPGMKRYQEWFHSESTQKKIASGEYAPISKHDYNHMTDYGATDTSSSRKEAISQRFAKKTEETLALADKVFKETKGEKEKVERALEDLTPKRTRPKGIASQNTETNATNVRTFSPE